MPQLRCLFVILTASLASDGEIVTRRRYADMEVIVKSEQRDGRVKGQEFDDLAPLSTHSRLSVAISGDWRSLCGTRTFDTTYDSWVAQRESLKEFRGSIVERLQIRSAVTTRWSTSDGQVKVEVGAGSQDLFRWGPGGSYEIVYMSSWCRPAYDAPSIYMRTPSRIEHISVLAVCSQLRHALAKTPFILKVRNDVSFGRDVFYPLWSPFEGPINVRRDEFQRPLQFPTASCEASSEACKCTIE
jgi:hypothetical protein